jgi:NADH/F420H2 dehydrogenase subunit C
MKKLVSYVVKFKFTEYLVSNLSIYIKAVVVNRYKDNISFYLRNTADLQKVIIFFKKHTQNQYLILSDIFAIDLLNETFRFQLVYCLLSIRYSSRIRLNIFANENDHINSLSLIYTSSGWVEREIWDLFGIFFMNHPDLRRILTDYGFEGFPLRKDFPLSGFTEIRYDDSLKRIVYEPLETTQEFRFFDFKSPWDQIENLY